MNDTIVITSTDVAKAKEFLDPYNCPLANKVKELFPEAKSVRAYTYGFIVDKKKYYYLTNRFDSHQYDKVKACETFTTTFTEVSSIEELRLNACW